MSITREERIVPVGLEQFLESIGGRLTYTYSEAARMASTTVADVEAAVGRGDVAGTFANATPVIAAGDLRRWLALARR